MEAVHVFVRQNCLEHLVFVLAARERKLAENTVGFRVGVEKGHQIKQFFF